MPVFRPETGPHAGAAVLAELAGLWERATDRTTRNGRVLTQKHVATQARIPEQTISSWSRGDHLPRDLDQLIRLGAALADLAGERALTGREWSRLLQPPAGTAPADDASRYNGPDRPGRRVGDVDPFDLEVHRPVEVGGMTGLPALPLYVGRAHDERLTELTGLAAAGRSVIGVLVGGSSTGKTRACWEAVQRLPDGWRIWHPYDPTRPEAALTGLHQIGPNTVVWLNETQFYLHTPDDTGERLAAALRTLLTDPNRAPVLILGTLWPDHWDTLTRPGDAHPQARHLLDGTAIPVPPAFTTHDLTQLTQHADQDMRLAHAAEHGNTTITQYLAGVPELLNRYQHAPPAARALIHAAMDARRLGHRHALPLALLETAAPGYLTPDEWDTLTDDWLEQALAYTARPAKGIRGPLTRIRPGHPTPPPTSSATPSGPYYRLADYLEQTGRTTRTETPPPDTFWTSLTHAHPDDLPTLAKSAHRRGLYRHAAQLHKNAVGHGNTDAARALIDLLHRLHPTDHRAAAWTAAHASLDNPYAVARLLNGFREAGADQQMTALLARDPAVHVSLDEPDAVAMLLYGFREAGADQQVTALLARDPAVHVSLDDPYAVAMLLYGFREAGADQQVTALAGRAAAHVSLDDPDAVAILLDGFRKAGADQQMTALLARDPAARVSLDDPDAVARLLDGFREAGADQQMTALGGRLSTAGGFRQFLEVCGDRERFRFGRESDGIPAAWWGWEELD